MNLADIATLITEITILVGVVVPLIVWIRKVADGQKCQLRSDMLAIYYNNRESKTIREYECQNFVLLYDSYKALKGNSFVDKIKDEVLSWEVIN